MMSQALPPHSQAPGKANFVDQFEGFSLYCGKQGQLTF
jgi:hypothetical protein